VSTFPSDVRYALRTLTRQPGFALVAIVTMALGIGANTAIFGVVNAVLLKPLPYTEPDRVVMLWSHWINWSKTWVSPPELDDYQRQARGLEHVGAFQYTSFNLTGSGDPLRVRAAQVQPALFAALGARPVAGRLFTAEEDRPGRDHVVVLAEGLWREQFGGDRGIIGRAISLDGAPYTVLGVLAAALRLPIDYASRATTQVWVPLALGPTDPQERGNHGLFALGRLAPGSSLDQAQAEMDTITRGFQSAFPKQYDREFGVTIVRAADEVFGAIRPALLLLLCAVGAVLLIACTNVANLLLARSEARQKEIAIRTVLGASRARLLRQLVTEAIVLSSAGGLAGIGLAYGLVRALVAIDPLRIPRAQSIAIDGAHPLVGVDIEEPVARGLLDGEVARGREIVAPSEMGNLGAVVGRQLDTAINRSGVDDDDLVDHRLERRQAGFKNPLFVANDQRSREGRGSSLHTASAVSVRCWPNRSRCGSRPRPCRRW